MSSSSRWLSPLCVTMLPDVQILCSLWSSQLIFLQLLVFFFWGKRALKLKVKYQLMSNQMLLLILADSIKFTVTFCWYWLNSRANLDIAYINSVIVRVPDCYNFDFCFFDSDILHYLHYPFTTLCCWHQTNSGHRPLNPAVRTSLSFQFETSVKKILNCLAIIYT